MGTALKVTIDETKAAAHDEILEVDVDEWPTMGQLFPVVYAPNNPDKWAFAPAGPPD